MENPIKLTEKYERNGWPALKRPDLESPAGLTLPLLTSLERVRSLTLSSRGQIACIKDGESSSDVYTMSANGSWLSRVSVGRTLAPAWDDEIPQWSPDGAWLAFTLDGHVHIVPHDGGLPKKITDFAPAASSPRWMPDSKGLIVSVERKDVDQLLLTNLDGDYPSALTTDSIGDHWEATPSPDGKFILYTLRRFDDLNRLDIVVLELATRKQITLYGKESVRAFSPKWSPDGQWISFIAQEGEREEIYLIEPNGEGLHQLTKAGEDIVQHEWSPSGRQILAVTNQSASFKLILVEVESGKMLSLRSEVGIHANPNWSQDESYIVFEFEAPTTPADFYKMDLKTKQVTQLTFSNPPALQNYPFVTPESVSYKSYDGLEIPALLYRPKKSNGAAILYPHGGPKDQYIFGFDDVAQYFTAKGYTYLAPNYRGSTGYGKSFERANYNDWGVGDLQDCLYGAKYLRALKAVQADKIGIAGGSYGGYLTIASLSRDPEYLFACGITKYGDSNLVSSWAQCEKRLRLYTEIFLGHPAENLEIYLKGSPITEAKNIQKPVLILHGLLDTVVPPEASEEWAEALKRENKTFEYKTYAAEPHGFLRPENLLDVYERMERFLDWYLLPK
ncbi:MAG: S9 family peptidase [Anaerolineales bacterium]|nr:S9 family peptidase [Anaerolineales bacterium]